ncbi:hypothetical protein PIB30_033854 [Stylosanthes scabra]|uniref:Uncharacterized protein n=1 Tax=Stylosanthes scabra TaxID=79078 RepID=A0ABU6RCZ3_9FABA|nr:hypothetical protein [Stylosanthes scabra]
MDGDVGCRLLVLWRLWGGRREWKEDVPTEGTRRQRLSEEDGAKGGDATAVTRPELLLFVDGGKRWTPAVVRLWVYKRLGFTQLGGEEKGARGSLCLLSF